MEQPATQNQINQILWSACDTFRGAFDSSEYKNYILNFMFIKYLSDVWRDAEDQYREKYKDEEIVKRKMSRERFVLPENCTFQYIYEHRKDSDIGEKIDKILQKIEQENLAKLDGVFRNISFNSDKLGDTKDRNRRLENLINDFANPILDFRPSLYDKNQDIIGNAYMFLIGQFASGAGKKGGEFYTPIEVSELVASLIQPKAGARISDPTCGSGSLLIKVAEHVTDENDKPSNDFALYGQDSNGEVWALCKMNMFLHDMDRAQIEWGDTLNSPKLLDNGHLMKFDVVVANPPFSLDKWGQENAEDDIYHRYSYGIPPRTKADYAFILHMVETAKEKGRVGVVVPHGVLFRGAAEGRIRKRLIDENLLEAVVGLPSNLFYGTGIPAAILILNKAKKHNDVLFVDASQHFEDNKRQNRLRQQDIDKVVEVYNDYKVAKAVKGDEGKVLVDKYAYRATFAEIQENDYNLNIPRYVDTFEEEEEIDIAAVQVEIEKLEGKLMEAKKEMNKYLNELNLLS